MNPKPRRGEIWLANTGGKRHAGVVISVNARNERTESILFIPFGSLGREGPTVIQMEPGETGLGETSNLKAHFISVVQQKDLSERLPRVMSQRQMRELVHRVNCAIDPDADASL